MLPRPRARPSVDDPKGMIVTRIRQRLGLLVVTALLAFGPMSAVGRARPVAAADAAVQRPDEEDGQLLRMLAYAPFGSELVNWSNLAGLKRRIGADVGGWEDVPPFPTGRRDDDRLTPRERAGRAWWWDVGEQIPVSDFTGLRHARGNAWDEYFGFDVFDVAYELQVGAPLEYFSVIEGAIDPNVSGDKLTALGYTSESSALGADATLYRRFDDYRQQLSDPVSRLTLSRFNRVVLEPGRLVAAPATAIVDRVVEAATGTDRSMAADPNARILASAMEDPALLPDTTLLGATLLAGQELDAVSAAGSIERDGTGLRLSAAEQERRRRQLGEALSGESGLPPYRAIGLGYRRGNTLTDRYWLFTLVYDDVTQAEEAGRVLQDRIPRYRSLVSGEPLLPTFIHELLPSVVRDYSDGVALSVLLRCADDRPAGWARFFQRRDLGFLAPGEAR